MIAIMELSNLKTHKDLPNSQENIYDPFRRIWIKSTPEELVRQKLLKKLINEMGYPAHLITIEKDLRQLPHLLHVTQKIPKRRADIICYSKDSGHVQSLSPFLLIECKAIELSSKVLQQVIGYNDYVKARYIAVANQEKILTGAFDSRAGLYRFFEKLPFYNEQILY